MKKRKLSDKTCKRIFLILCIIGVVIGCAACRLTSVIFHGAHESQYESCEQEARKRLEEIISFVDSKQSENPLVSYDIPSVTVKSAPDSEIGVTAEYRNGKIVIRRNLTSAEELVVLGITIISVAIYYELLIICIRRIRKKRALASGEEESAT